MFRLRPLQFTRTLATHASPNYTPAITRNSWGKQEIQQIYDTPLMELVFRAATVHRQHHDPSKIQLCTLMNIKSALIPLYSLSQLTLNSFNSWWMLGGLQVSFSPKT